MKRIPLKHVVWSLITIGAFAWGQFRSEPERVEGKQVGKGEHQFGSHHPGSSRGKSTKTERGGGSLRGRSPHDGKTQANKKRNAGGLTEGQIAALVNDAVKLGTPVERRLALDRILRGIHSSEISFEEALAIRNAMRAHGAGEERRLLEYAMGAFMSDEAMVHLDELPSEERVGFLKEMIPGLAGVNPVEAIALFESLDPQLQAQVRPKFLEGLVDNDVGMATEYLYDSSDLENYHWRPMAELTRELVKDQGLQPTLDWADELPQGPQRRDAWSAAYAVWASKDPVAAVESIIELPQGADRNLAINGFISAHVRKDGEMALTWADEISEPGLKRAAQIRVARQYYAQDPAGTNEWFASSGLPPSAWEQITSVAIDR